MLALIILLSCMYSLFISDGRQILLFGDKINMPLLLIVGICVLYVLYSYIINSIRLYKTKKYIRLTLFTALSILLIALYCISILHYYKI